ncbi:AP2 domain transcription factor AP2XI-3, partial [Cardiosporidium cionae]
MVSSGYPGVSWNNRMKAWLTFYYDSGHRRSRTFHPKYYENVEGAKLAAIQFAKTVPTTSKRADLNVPVTKCKNRKPLSNINKKKRRSLRRSSSYDSKGREKPDKSVEMQRGANLTENDTRHPAREQKMPSSKSMYEGASLQPTLPLHEFPLYAPKSLSKTVKCDTPNMKMLKRIALIARPTSSSSANQAIREKEGNSQYWKSNSMEKNIWTNPYKGDAMQLDDILTVSPVIGLRSLRSLQAAITSDPARNQAYISESTAINESPKESPGALSS